MNDLHDFHSYRLAQQRQQEVIEQAEQTRQYKEMAQQDAPSPSNSLFKKARELFKSKTESITFADTKEIKTQEA